MVRSLNPQKRAQFLSTALTLFVTQGVMNTSTAEIARTAGAAAGTLFLYFPTKQALLDELVLKIAKDQSERINSLLVPSLSARETFYTIWSGTLHWFLENMEAYLYLQQVRDTGLISEGAVQESAKSFGYYFEAIQKGLSEGMLKPYSAGLMGDFLYHDMVAVMNHLRSHPDPATCEGTIQQGFDIYWSGISLPQVSARNEAQKNEI